MSNTELYSALERMKKALARMADNANRWPKPESNVVTLHDEQPLSDAEKKIYGQSFSWLWPEFERIEKELIRTGMLDAPIPLTDKEEEAIPF